MTMNLCCPRCKVETLTNFHIFHFQIEKWHIVSRPQEDFMFVMWCGTNPALDYNGAFVLSRGRTEEGMQPGTLAEFQAVAAKHGVEWNSMCISDNTNCPESP